MLPPGHATTQTDDGQWYHQNQAFILIDRAAVQERFIAHNEQLSLPILRSKRAFLTKDDN